MTIYGTVVYIIPIGGAAIDASCDVAEVSINHGRSDPGAQPEASTASITMPLGMVANVEIGAYVQVVNMVPGYSIRFVGWVTDMATEWETRFDPDHGDMVVLPVARIMAAGPLSDSGRRYVGDIPWPQELDGARVARVLAALPGGMVGPVDPGTVQVLPRDVDRQAALGLMQDVANDAAGVVWESKDGLIGYADATHRKGIPIGVTLDACDVLMSPRWSRTRSGLVNDVAVTYGAGATRPVVTATDDGSIAAYGRTAYSITTDLAAAADATALAQLLMVRNSEPVWLLDGIKLDLSILDATKTAALLALDVHSLVAITGFPAGGPSSSATLWVEGWTEDISYGQHALSLFVSAYCRTAPPVTWDEIPPAWTWDTMGNAVSNPSMETAAGTAVVRTNLFPNPRAAVDVASFSWWPGNAPGNGTFAPRTGQTGWAFAVPTSARATWTVTAGTGPAGGIHTSYAIVPVTPGRTYTAGAQARCSKVQRIVPSVLFTDGANAWVGETYGAVHVMAANTVETFTATGVAPTGAVYALMTVFATAGTGATEWAAGDWLEVSNVHIEESDQTLTFGAADPIRGMFGGWFTTSTIYGADFTYQWAGAANASPSQMLAPAVAGHYFYGEGVAHQSSERARNGAKSMRVMWGTAGARGGAPYWNPGISQVPGQTYTMSAYVYVPTGSPAVILNTGGAEGTDSGTVKDAWVRLAFTYVYTSGSVNHFVMPAAATVRGDDRCYVEAVQLEQGPVPTDYRGSLLWDDATCFGGPLPTFGRWADVPASTRWDDVAATVTWDTWTG